MWYFTLKFPRSSSFFNSIQKDFLLSPSLYQCVMLVTWYQVMTVWPVPPAPTQQAAWQQSVSPAPPELPPLRPLLTSWSATSPSCAPGGVMFTLVMPRRDATTVAMRIIVGVSVMGHAPGWGRSLPSVTGVRSGVG